MNDDLQQRLLSALLRCLRPLAKLLLGAGISHAQFDDVSKRAFVEAALDDPKSTGGGMTTSRIAVRTGLSRKEVARLRSAMEQGPVAADSFHVGRPARALQLWYSSPEFLDNNNPIDLPFDGDGPSFVSLIKEVGGDVPPGAVRAELLAAGAIVETSTGLLRAQKRFFVPSNLDEDLIVGFLFVVGPILDTLRHNIEFPLAPFVQRVSYSDRLPQSAIPAFRSMANVQAELLMNDVDKWLGEHETTIGPTEDSEGRVGLGIFYYERPG